MTSAVLLASLLIGLVTRVTYGGGGRVVDSTYDRLNRLSTMTEGGRPTTYGYDLAGNVLSKTLPNGDLITTTYDVQNRTSTIVGQNIANTQLYSYGLLYDAVGNLKHSTEGWT